VKQGRVEARPAGSVNVKENESHTLWGG
jgi:hypothetical protein